MTSLELENFKAHQNLKIPFDEKNFLLYGDNGAGKSSIYEALKLFFFKEKVEEDIKKSASLEEQEEKIKEFYREYNNQVLNQDFLVKINNSINTALPRDDYGVYMLTLEELFFNQFLELDKLLKITYFDLQINDREQYEEIVAKANEYLIRFQENITITLDDETYTIKITDTSRNLQNIKNVKKYFNEAKLNLVLLSLLFSAIEIFKDENKKNILILDDFITSLDMANRTFLIKSILENFKDFQILIFTHNVYFYNLIMYLIDEKICRTNKKWQFANMYEIDDTHKIYFHDIRIKTSDIKNLYEQEKRKPTPDFKIVGNQLRQKFERLLYEFSKLLMIGGVEESNKILEIIERDSKFYFFKDASNNKNSNDLVGEIANITTSLADVQQKIDEYTIHELDTIKDILRNLKLYRKVSMHSLSHGRIGEHAFTSKEVGQTLIFIEMFENNVKELIKSKSVDGA